MLLLCGVKNKRLKNIILEINCNNITLKNFLGPKILSSSDWLGLITAKSLFSSYTACSIHTEPLHYSPSMVKDSKSTACNS